MFYKRGQAAMEFLMTYGWAILAAIVVIAVLAAFGVFSPGRYVPASCVVNAPWGCEEYKANTTGILLALRNGGGEDLTITNIAITVKQPSGVTCTSQISATGHTVQNGGLSNITEVVAGVSNSTTLNCPDWSLGQKFSGDITITYRKAGGTLTMVSTGSITQTITA